MITLSVIAFMAFSGVCVWAAATLAVITCLHLRHRARWHRIDREVTAGARSLTDEGIACWLRSPAEDTHPGQATRDEARRFLDRMRRQGKIR